MSKYQKPDVSSVWASGGDISAPLPSKIATGWIIEKPPHEIENWLQNRQDSFLRYVNQLGIPEWDSVTEYQANQSYVQSSTTGLVYRCKTTHTNRKPDSDTAKTYWNIAFDLYGAAAAVQAGLDTLNGKYPNLTGINAGTSRTNLNVYSKDEINSVTAGLNAAIAAAATPTGSIMAMGNDTSPSGWLVCDGTSRTSAAYPALYAYLGTRWGVGDGSAGSFSLPDLRGESLRGWDNGRGVDIGRTVGSWQDGQNASHTHRVATTASFDANAFGLNNTSYAVKGLAGVVNGGSSTYISKDVHDTGTQIIENTGGTETRVRNIAVLYCIKT